MIVVLDWDGTVTEQDTLTMALEHFGQQELYDRAEEGLQAGELDLRGCMDLEFSGMRASLDEVVAFVVERARLRPGFADFARRFRPLILSSSFEETIRPVLRREGLELEVVANSVEAGPEGWRVLWRDETLCATCGEACKRASLPAGEVVYVGDGWSDRCAALAADRVFARDGLAAYLDEQGAAYEPFTDFVALAAAVG
ncbi:MAG: 2-hydroxy-3-keto-5-methylthiopentenyl-phosphate phosphatase [Gaiellaceae bacterium]|nr:2-hydroxy-3-keto-5-methylthiopentenyl-phosphate phosphatase [Gaiellaceae bacterium]